MEQAAIFAISFFYFSFFSCFFSFWFYSCFFNVLFTYANRISVQFNCAARLKVCIGYSHRPFFLSLLQQSGGHMKQPANTLTPTPTAHTHTQTLGPHNLPHTHITAFLFDQLLICTKPMRSRAPAELPRFLYVVCV